MAFTIITIPFEEKLRGFDGELLEKFCMNKYIHQMYTHFFTNSLGAYWTFMLEYEIAVGSKKKDVATGKKESEELTKELNDPQKLLYDKLRHWRNDKADEEGIPPFVIAKNSDLVLIVKEKVNTMKGFELIKGFGTKKREKYGKEIVDLINTFYQDEQNY